MFKNALLRSYKHSKILFNYYVSYNQFSKDLPSIKMRPFTRGTTNYRSTATNTMLRESFIKKFMYNPSKIEKSMVI